jgi:hypothetical protein
MNTMTENSVSPDSETIRYGTTPNNSELANKPTSVTYWVTFALVVIYAISLAGSVISYFSTGQPEQLITTNSDYITLVPAIPSALTYIFAIITSISFVLLFLSTIALSVEQKDTGETSPIHNFVVAHVVGLGAIAMVSLMAFSWGNSAQQPSSVEKWVTANYNLTSDNPFGIDTNYMKSGNAQLFSSTDGNYVKYKFIENDNKYYFHQVK